MQPFMAQICTFGITFPPRDWTYAAGQLLQISQYQAIYALVGTLYGGDGRVTFGVPDMRGRKAIGSSQTGGQGPGLPYYVLGQRSGWYERTLTVANLPAHNHDAVFTPAGGSAADVQVSTADADVKEPGPGDYLAVVGDGATRSPTQQAAYVAATSAGTTVSLGGVSGGGGSGVVSVGNTGSGVAFSTEDPYTAVNFCFALDGIFPPRN